WDRHGRLLMHNANFRDFFAIDEKALRPGAQREDIERIMRLAVAHEQPTEERRSAREAQLNDGRWIRTGERRTAEGGRVMTAADITAIKAQEEARRLNEEQ